jgi:hypothetical protein
VRNAHTHAQIDTDGGRAGEGKRGDQGAHRHTDSNAEMAQWEEMGNGAKEKRAGSNAMASAREEVRPEARPGSTARRGADIQKTRRSQHGAQTDEMRTRPNRSHFAGPNPDHARKPPRGSAPSARLWGRLGAFRRRGGEDAVGSGVFFPSPSPPARSRPRAGNAPQPTSPAPAAPGNAHHPPRRPVKSAESEATSSPAPVRSSTRTAAPNTPRHRRGRPHRPTTPQTPVYAQNRKQLRNHLPLLRFNRDKGGTK